MELQHFSHEHPLILGEINDHGEAIVCKGCCQNISGSAYSCLNCLFFLHKLCAELPAEIKHPFHEMHPLTLQQPLSPHNCDVCYLRIHGFTYRCSPCDFDVDIRCTFRAQHFSDKHHQLILLHQNEEKKNDDGKRVSCDGCLQPFTGSAAYTCTICSISLHKLCAELPAEMQHQMHPEHPLTLVAIEPYKFRCDSCHACSKALFTYRCTLCNFNLDISCALRAQSVKHESHIHPLIPVLSPATFECHACRTKREDISYMCNTCSFWIHESCVSLPTTFKHNSHVHPLSLICSIPEEHSHFSWCECRVCDLKLQRGNFCWFYACDGCEYYIHVNCSSKTKERKIAIKIEDFDEANLIHLPISDDQSVNLIDQFVKQISLRDIKKEVKDNYFSHHHHPLILFDAQGDNDLCSMNELLILNEQKNKKICNACVQQISVPFYSCSLCDFFLHKWCAELPNELKHPCHQHQLILLKKCPKNRGLFWCDCCRNDCNGFAFKCVECEHYCLDVKCACLPSSIIHKIHDCPLFLRENCIAEGCVACPRHIQMFSFGCDTCNIYLHYTCALLPHTIIHRYDKHSFTLIYAPIEDGSDEYICEFCEEEIDPKWWFYHCIHCDQSACAKCIYKEEKEYPTIKWGITYDDQPHPLVLVKATNKTPRCDHCHRSLHIFDRFAFKCEQCDIMLHPDCPHPNISSYLE